MLPHCVYYTLGRTSVFQKRGNFSDEVDESNHQIETGCRFFNPSVDRPINELGEDDSIKGAAHIVYQ